MQVSTYVFLEEKNNSLVKIRLDNKFVEYCVWISFFIFLFIKIKGYRHSKKIRELNFFEKSSRQVASCATTISLVTKFGSHELPNKVANTRSSRHSTSSIWPHIWLRGSTFVTFSPITERVNPLNSVSNWVQPSLWLRLRFVTLPLSIVSKKCKLGPTE